mgnify:CR=1 FL=1
MSGGGQANYRMNPAWLVSRQNSISTRIVGNFLEEMDNGANLNDIALPRDATLRAEFDGGLLGGVVVIRGEARRRDAAGWEDALYRAARSATEVVPLVAVPYYAWANRAPGEMLVWIREG